MYTKKITTEVFDEEKISVGDIIELDGIGIETGIRVRGLVEDVSESKITLIDLDNKCPVRGFCFRFGLLPYQSEERCLKVISKKQNRN